MATEDYYKALGARKETARLLEHADDMAALSKKHYSASQGSAKTFTRTRHRSTGQSSIDPATFKLVFLSSVAVLFAVLIWSYVGLGIASVGLKTPDYSPDLPEIKGEKTSIRVGLKSVSLHSDAKFGTTVIYKAPHKLSSAPDWDRVERALGEYMSKAPEEVHPDLTRVLTYWPVNNANGALMAQEITTVSNALRGPMAHTWHGRSSNSTKAINSMFKRLPNAKLVTCFYLEDGFKHRKRFYYHSSGQTGPTWRANGDERRTWNYPFNAYPFNEVIDIRDDCPGRMPKRPN